MLNNMAREIARKNRSSEFIKKNKSYLEFQAIKQHDLLNFSKLCSPESPDKRFEQIENALK
jgi:hypothetical protein